MKSYKELQEELKSNQKKLDANHNGKLDSDDFKKIRKSKEKCCTEEFQLDELSAATLNSYRLKNELEPKSDKTIKTKARRALGLSNAKSRLNTINYGHNAGKDIPKGYVRKEEVEIDD